MTMNPIIEVEGQMARGTWYFFGPFTMEEGSRAMWQACRYHETYRKVNGQWLIAHLKISGPRMAADYREGHIPGAVSLPVGDFDRRIEDFRRRFGHDAPVAKLSYVKLFKPWNWVIGTGVYLVVMAVAGYYLRSEGGEWGPFLQAVFLAGAVEVFADPAFKGHVLADHVGGAVDVDHGDRKSVG